MAAIGGGEGNDEIERTGGGGGAEVGGFFFNVYFDCDLRTKTVTI